MTNNLNDVEDETSHRRMQKEIHVLILAERKTEKFTSLSELKDTQMLLILWEN